MRYRLGRSLLLVMLLLWPAYPAIAETTPPRNVVSLDLCSDWLLLRLVGSSTRVRYSSLLYQNPPAWVPEGLPVHDGRLETLINLSPDLVVSGEFNAWTLRQRLGQLGFNVLSLKMPSRLVEIDHYINQLAAALKHPQIEVYPTQHYPLKGERLLLSGANGMAIGSASLEHEMIEHAGFENYLQQPGFQRVNLEQLLTDPPDRMLYTARYARSPALAYLLQQHPAIQLLPSSQDDPIQHDWRWMCPGPWSHELVDDLAKWRRE